MLFHDVSRDMETVNRYRLVPWVSLVFLWVLVFPIYGEVISFSPPTYSIDKPIEGQDGWVRALEKEGDSLQYVVVSQDDASGRLHANTGGQYTLTRAFSNSVSALDLKWRWRFDNTTTVKFCMGVGRPRDTANIPLKFCVYPGGILHYTSSTGNILNTEYKPGTLSWKYMKLHVDLRKGLWVLTSSTQATRVDEEVVVDSTPVPSSMKVVVSTDPLSGKVGRLFLRNEDGDSEAGVDLDDIDWQRADSKTWIGSKDSLWTTSGNWSPTGVPDSTDIVLFNSASTRGCQLDKAVEVEDVLLQSDFTKTLHLSGYNLVVHGSAEFSGGRIRGNASVIKFRGPKLHTLMAPTTDTLPTLHVEGPGHLQLAARPVRALGLKITGGGLDLNAMNLDIDGDLTLQTGNANSILGIGGRILSVSGTATLNGSATSLLQLAPTERWTITAKKGLTASYAQIGFSTSNALRGVATASIDKGNNENWLFKDIPKIQSGPDTLKAVVNESHSISVKVLNPIGGETFRWTRNGKIEDKVVTGEFLLTGLTLANHGDVFVCTVTNSEGSTVSEPTVLVVAFPAPTPITPEGEFADSLLVKFQSAVSSSVIWASRDGGAFERYVPTTIKTDTRWDVYSVLVNDRSDTGTFFFYSANRPKAEMPTLVPKGADFSDSVKVALSVTAPSTTVFRLDTLVPDTSDQAYLAPLTFTHTTVITAIGVGDRLRNSLPVRALFLDTTAKADLPPPLAKPSAGIVDSMTIIQLTVDSGSIWYRFQPGIWTYSSNGKVALLGKTKFEAIAIHGTRQSPIQKFEYLNRLSAPLAIPSSQRFRDSLYVKFSTTSKDAKIYAAINRSPTENDLLADSLRIDNTCFIRAIAIRGRDSSELSEVQYQLEPEVPTASPLPANLTVPGLVTLTSPTVKGSIYFTLDGTDPVSTNWSLYTTSIALDSSKVIKAVTVTGTGVNQLVSPIFSAVYAIKPIVKGIVLKPNDTLNLHSQWDLALNVGGSGLIKADKAILPTGLTGFDSISNAFQIQGTQVGDTISIILADSLKNEKAIWYLPPGVRKPFRLPKGDVIALKGDGFYFAAIDTLPPVLRFSGSSINSEKFTVATFTLDDNSAALDYQIWRTDQKDSVYRVQNAATEILVKLNLKNAPKSVQNLGVRLCATESEGKNQTCLPNAENLFLPLQQYTNGLVTPEVLSIGKFADSKWDLIGIPFDMDSGLTVQQFQSLNDRKDMVFAHYDASAKKGIRYLEPKDKLVSGKGYWVASAEPLATLTFGPGQMLVPSETAYQYTLVKGWNAISAKQMQTVAWPIQRSDSAAYRRSSLKGLWAVHRDEDGVWDKRDSLSPWLGYYVFWKGEFDTLIDLAKPMPVGKSVANLSANTAAKKAMQLGSNDWVIVLSQAGASLELGAFEGASDGFSFEDEPSLPSAWSGGPVVASLRGKQTLGTDYVGLQPGKLHRWTVRWEKRQGSPFQIRHASLPPGHGLIAYSKSRGVGVDWMQGQDEQGGVAGMEAPLGFADTLEVLAGPMELLQREWAKWPKLPQNESIRWLGLGKLALDLVDNRKVSVQVLDAKGRIQDQLERWLAPGHVILEVPKGRAKVASGPQWVRVVLKGQGPSRSQSFPWFGF